MRETTRLNVSQLETRIVPSLAPVPPKFSPPAMTAVAIARPTFSPTPVATPSPAIAHTTTPLASTTPHPSAPAIGAGAGSGVYDCTLVYSGVNTGFHFTGTANIQGLGTADVLVDVRGPGLNVNSTARGTAMIGNAQGSMTLRLTGPAQPPLSPLPQLFTYEVISATGIF